MFFWTKRKGKTRAIEDEAEKVTDNGGDIVAAEAKASNSEAPKDAKKLKVIVESGDFIIKDNSIKEALGERFFAELKGNSLHLGCEDDCLSFSSSVNQTIIGNNNIMAGGCANIIQSGNGGVQTIGRHSGCSVQRSNGVEVRNYGGTKIEINTTRDIPIYVNGKLVENTKNNSKNTEEKDESIKIFSLDDYCISDIVIDGSGSMIATDEHSYCNMPALIVKGSGDIVFEHRKNKGEFEGFACFIYGSGDIEVKNLETKNFEAEIQGSGDIRLVNISGEKANFSVIGSGDIVGRKVVFENKTKNIKGSGDISGV